MRAELYPGYVRHKAAARPASSPTSSRSRGARGAGCRFMSIRINHWLSGWLKEHVSGTDGQIARFLAQRSA